MSAMQAIAKATESVNQKVPSARQLMKSGQAVNSEMDAVNRFGNGERLFAFHEMSGTPLPIRSVDELKNFTYDQLLSLPTAKANGGAMRMPFKKTQGFVEGTSYGKSMKDRLRQAAPLSPIGIGLNAGYAGYKYLTGEDPLEDLRRKLDAKINPDIDTGAESDQQFEKLRKGGAIRMQVGGLSALAKLGKAGTLANKANKGLDAARRAELLMHSGDNALPLILPRARMSSDFIDQQADRVARQMLGEHVTSGKDTTNLAGRSVKESQRVKGLNYKTTPTGTVSQETPYTPRKGDVKVAFPGDQTVSNKILDEVEGFPIDSVQEGGAYYGLGQRHLSDPEFWKSTETPAKAVQGKVDRVAELYQPERVIGSHLAMGPMSNNFAMHFADANLRAIDWSKAKPNNVNVFDSIIAYGYKDPKTGERVKFPNWPGLADREGALAAMKEDSNLRKWFNNRMKTPTITKPLGLPNGLDIQYAVTEPRIRDMEINMTGLMTGKLKPNAPVEAAGNPHNTYTHRILGEAGGPQEVLTPFVIDFPDAAQHIASTKRPSDFTGTIQKVFPHQIVDDQYLNEYNQYRERIKKLTGQKDGGSIEAKPFHDFDQIMKRKDGGTVNQSFEQQLMSALANYQANPDMLVAPSMRRGGEVHMVEGGSSAPKKDLPDMSPQKYLELLALQPKLGLQSEKQIKAFLEDQYRKEKEAGGFADKQARIDRAIKTVTPAIGAGADIGNFFANIPSYATQGLSAVGNYAMSKSPSMSKPASVLDTEGTGDRVPKYPLQSLPEVEPFYGSAAMQRDAQNAGLMGESESPVYDMAMQFLAPYGAYKAPKAIKGGLQMAKESPTLQKGAEYAGRGYSLAKVPVQRPFTPATATVEATAPDLGQNTTYGFRQGLNDVLLENPKLGTGRNKMREGQGTFINTKEKLELNPLLAIDVPRAGNIGDVPNANKALRQQMAQMGVDLNQEAMAAHRFIPLATNNVRDASSALIKTKEGLTADEVAELAKALGGKMAVTHNPRLGGVVVFPFGSVREGLIPRELLRAQQAAEKLLGKRGEVQFGISDYGKDRAYMLAKEGDYQKAGAKPMSKEQQAQRERLQGLEKFLFPESRSGIPGQVKAAPVGGLQPWSVGPEYPTSVIGIGNGSRVQYQPRNFSTGQQGSRYDKYAEAEAERAKMLDEFHRALVPKYR